MRVQGHDYASRGGYFLTMCTQGRISLFGDVVSGEMRLNGHGEIVCAEWFKTADARATVFLDANEFVVMPNHVHGIIWIIQDTLVGGGPGGSPLPMPPPNCIPDHRARDRDPSARSSDNSSPCPPSASTSIAASLAPPSGNAVITNTSSVARTPWIGSANISSKTPPAGNSTAKIPCAPNKPTRQTKLNRQTGTPGRGDPGGRPANIAADLPGGLSGLQPKCL
jgi:hypothetical protein